MPELILAFDTATDASALAIGERIGSEVSVLESRDFEAPRAALGRLLPEAAELLSRRSLVPSDLGEIVVGRGPGSFTGVRIGVATAKGLAHGLGAPLFGVGTLDAIAWACADRQGLLGVVGDAMRGEVYPALFRLSGGAVERLEDDCVMSPQEAADTWAREVREPLLLAGNGLRKYTDFFAAALGDRASILPESLWAPTGAGLLAEYAAKRARDEHGSGDAAALLPVYTRLSDAEEAERDRAGHEAPPPDSGVSGPPGEGG